MKRLCTLPMVFAVSMALTVFLIVPTTALGSSHDQTKDKVLFVLDWLPIGKHVPFYVAQEFGYFDREGLSVTIGRGFGSGDSVKKADAGAAEFSMSDAGVLIRARAKGAKVKLISMHQPLSLLVIHVLRGSGIEKPQDLNGRSIGAPPGEASRVLFPAFAAANGIDPKTIKWVNVTQTAAPSALVLKQVDAISTYMSAYAALLKAAKEMAVEPVNFLYREHGVDIYSNGLIAHDKTVAQKPDLVKRFLRAALQGIVWSMEDSEKAVDIYYKYNSGFERKVIGDQWDETSRDLRTPEAEAARSIGYMSQEKMKRTRDVIVNLMEEKTEILLDDIYTNDFLPGLYPKK